MGQSKSISLNIRVSAINKKTANIFYEKLIFL